MALSVCKICGNSVGIVYQEYLKAVDKQNKADNKPIISGSTFVPAQTKDGVGQILNDLGLQSQCCRVSVMSFHHV
jgi:DNA-directed RNA polymerase subunit N (RpoN/RPB10)